MASELYVETLKGLTSGANANKVIIPSGQQLIAPGHVIQVVSNSYETNTAVSSGAWINMVEVTITPTSATNKIYLQASSCFYMTFSDTLSTAIFKNGASVKTTGNGWLGYNKHDVSNTHRDTITHIFMDTAGSTSPITYSFQAYSTGTGTNFSASGTPSIITVMEIAG